MSQARLVDQAALEAHSRMLAAQAPDVYARLRLGLPEAEIRAKFDAAGMCPSLELIRWWSFWDRAPATEPPAETPFNLDVLPLWAFLTVDDRIEMYSFNRELARKCGSELGDMRIADEAWHPRWIPLFWEDGGCVAADCRGPADSSSPLMALIWSSWGDTDYGTPFSPSLGELLIRATEWLTREQARFVPARRLWRPLDDYYMKWPEVLELPPVDTATTAPRVAGPR